MKTTYGFLCAVAMVALAGCPPDTTTPEPTDSGTVAFECDPVGANPTVGELYNAPLDEDAEVIVKEPQHPGNPGPTDLP